MLSKDFEIKDLGKLRCFLGIEVARLKKGIFLSQIKYVLDLLKETVMLGCIPRETPIDPKHNLGSTVESATVNKGCHQRLVGKLIYLSHTRLDIAFVVSVVSQYMHSPCENHMEADLKILRYLKEHLERIYSSQIIIIFKLKLIQMLIM